MSTIDPPPGPSEPTGDLTSPFDLRQAFVAKQNVLLAALAVTVEFTKHGTTVGDSSEADWCAMLRTFLPARYGTEPIFAVDSKGRQSQQIDVGIYDRQYAPLWFRTSGGVLIVPVESVYAAFEIKQEINKTLADYTSTKIESVRALHRTSAWIKHAGGEYPPQKPEDKPILGGILALRSGWATGLDGQHAVQALTGRTPERRIDLGIALDTLSFDINPVDDSIHYSEPDLQLINFVMRLFARLQALGTALAIEMDKYEDHIRTLDDGSH